MVDTHETSWIENVLGLTKSFQLIGFVMTRIIFSSLIVACALTVATAPSAEPANGYRYAGRSGIVFVWNGSWDIGVGTVEGGIGYKRWMSKRLALKTFVVAAKEDTTIVYGSHYPVRERRIRERRFSLLLGAEAHFGKRNRLSLFAGGAIQVRFLRSTIDEYGGRFPIRGLKNDSNTWGVQGTLGLEYFLLRGLSLQTGYQVDLSLIETTGRRDWSLDISTSSFSLILYL